MKFISLRSIVAFLVLVTALIVMSPFATKTIAHDYTQADCDSADATCVLALASAYNVCEDEEENSNGEYSSECNDALELAAAACSAAAEICSHVDGNNF